mgnify:CR=1 FL=1
MSPASPSAPRLPRVVVVGPTATGKSALALDLSETIQTDEPETRAEIINADASLLYRGMDIGTAKPSPAERARVPHHQIDVLTVRDRASVAAFQRSARGDIDAVESRGHLPIIVGGSGLYVRALTDLGLSANEAFDSILFRVSANTNQFVTISRLRALRTLWNRVGEVLGVAPEKRGAVQHAVTSLREITRDDAYVNVLRGTISAFAAAIGQAETITVLPLDTAIGLPDVLTRRIARNTQLFIQQESKTCQTVDPRRGPHLVFTYQPELM